MASGIAIHLFNVSDASHRHYYNLRTPSPGNLPTKLIAVVDGNSSKQIIKAVFDVAEGRKCAVMRILAHGNSGQLAFPQMQDADSLSSDFKSLRVVFAPGSRLAIHGCGVASDTDIMRPGVDYRHGRTKADYVDGTFRGAGAGLRYLRRVASVFNVKVTGGVNVQSFDEQWSYDGPTVTVTPDGKYVLESEEMRDWDVAATERSAAAFWTRIQRDFIRYKAFDQARVMIKDLLRRFPRTEAAALARPYAERGRLETENRMFNDTSGFD